MRSARIESFLIGLIISIPAFSTNYYVSTQGNDANSGTSPSAPWRSLEKVSSISHTLVAGDSVFFRRGDTFFGTLNLNKPGAGNASRYVYVGAYGTGANPIFTGAIQSNTWVPSSLGSGIWETTLPGNAMVSNVFLNDILLPAARFPKNGLAITPSALPNAATLISSTINKPKDYWKGCRVVFRATKYGWFERTITYSNGDTIRFGNPPGWDDFTKSGGWGFYIEGKTLEISDELEWAVDSTSKKLYIKSSQNPNLLDLKIAHVTHGIQLPDGSGHRRYITIENIQFEKYAINGIHSIQNRDLNIQNCAFKQIYNMGIWYRLPSAGIANVSIENCTFDQIRWGGIHLHNAADVRIRNNTIQNTQYGRGIEMVGLDVLIHTVYVENNHIKNTGSVGIAYHGGPIYIRKNILESNTMENADVGAINGYKCGNGTVIEDNIVFNGKIGTQGIPAVFPNYGIYLDEDSYQILVRNNTIYNCHNGLLCNNGVRDVTITGNTIFNNQNNQLQIQRVTISGDTGRFHQNLIVRDNVICANSPTQVSLRINVSYPQTQQVQYVNNVFNNPFHPNHIVWNYTALSTASTPSRIRAGAVPMLHQETGQNSGNKSTSWQWKFFRNVSATGPNLVPNGTLDNNTSGWSNFPGSIFSRDVTTFMGPALRLAPTQSHIVFTTPANMTILSGELYRFIVRHRSNLSVSGLGWGIYNVATGGGAFGSRFFPLTNAVQTDTLYALATRDVYGQGRLQFDAFQSSGTMWLDDLSFQRIQADTTDQGHYARIYTNPSDNPISIPLDDAFYYEPDGTAFNNPSVHLTAWQSKVLYRIPKPVATVVGFNVSRAFGQANPPLGGTILGINPSDDISLVANTNAIISSPAGNYPILVTVAGTSVNNYTYVFHHATLTIEKASQGITGLHLPEAVTLSGANHTILLTASVTSGLPLTYSVTGPAVIQENELHLLDSGVVVVTAGQSGNSNYHPALSVIASIRVYHLPPAPVPQDTTNSTNPTDTTHIYDTFVTDTTNIHPILTLIGAGDLIQITEDPSPLQNIISENLETIEVYPNPNNGTFNVSTATPVSWQLLDSVGKIIWEAPEPCNNFNIQNLKPGLYFIKTTNGLQSKLVVQ